MIIFFISCGETKTIMPVNCNKGAENSILQKCTDLNKSCIIKNQIAKCGDCFTGYRNDNDTCIKIKTCSDLSCEEENRYCEQFYSEEDAECSDCKEGFKVSGDSCEAVITCDMLNCSSQNKECRKSGKHRDAECSNCLDFFKKDGNQCVPVIKCESLSCDLEHKACIHNSLNEDAKCSDNCLTGFHKNEDGICVGIIDCESLNCFSENQVCIPATPLSDAVCGRCMGGFVKNQEDVCLPMEYTTCDAKPAHGSISLECEEEHRKCIARTEIVNAKCGECMTGYNLVNNRCVMPTQCVMLNCESAHKVCEQISLSENWKCGECKDGFIFDSEEDACVCNSGTILNRDTDLCEPLKTCSDITCKGDEYCIEGTNSYGAYCSRCEKGKAWDGISCISCPLCNNKGETGKVYPVTSIQKHCICETKENYFYSRSSLSTRACDEDKDGWVTEEARVVIESPQNSADKVNAKCNIRYIDKFILKNENEQKRIILISDLTNGLYDKIPLYEVESRDNQEKLNIDYTYGTASFFAPAYGKGIVNTDTFYFNTSQLNMLTKAIPAGSTVNKVGQADYNANGIPDIDEKPWNISVPSSISEIFMKFSYYIELNIGWYQKNSDELYGSYVISEKKRDSNALPELSINLVNSDNSSKYWQKCYRKRDSKFNKPSGTGLDFAEFGYGACIFGNPDSWCGMNHHSQFKAFKIVNDNELDPLNPQFITISKLKKNYIVNTCFSYNSEFNVIGNGEYNPKTPILECSFVENPDTDLQTGELVWAISKYKDYDNINSYYEHGCIDECTDMGLLPQNDWCRGGNKCSTAPGEYGKVVCSEGIEMSKIIPAGIIFEMESDYFSKLSYSYEISTKEIDQTIFEMVMGYNPSFYSCGHSSCPVESLTWYDAVAFTNRYTELLYEDDSENCYELTNIICAADNDILSVEELNSETEKYCQQRGGILSANVVRKNINECSGYRLPTEVEWEFAAKGSDYNEDYYIPFGSEMLDNLSDIAWFSETEAIRTMPTALKLPNKYLLFDMLGNVKEWIHDDYSEFLTNTVDEPSIDYVNIISPESTITKSVKGGGFNSDEDACKNMARDSVLPTERLKSLGFRIAKTEVSQECRTYLKSANISLEISSIEYGGRYQGVYSSDYNMYTEKLFDLYDELKIEIRTVYSTLDDFIYDNKSSKNAFFEKNITVNNMYGIITYSFTKEDGNIVVTKNTDSDFRMEYPVIDGNGTMETDECKDILLKIKYTMFTQKMTVDYSNSVQREQGESYNIDLDTCRNKINEIYNNKIDTYGNIIDFEWPDIKVHVNNSLYDEYRNVCK